jgi:hypothetical protein
VNNNPTPTIRIHNRGAPLRPVLVAAAPGGVICVVGLLNILFDRGFVATIALTALIAASCVLLVHWFRKRDRAMTGDGRCFVRGRITPRVMAALFPAEISEEIAQAWAFDNQIDVGLEVDDVGIVVYPGQASGPTSGGRQRRIPRDDIDVLDLYRRRWFDPGRLFDMGVLEIRSRTNREPYVVDVRNSNAVAGRLSRWAQAAGAN